MRSTTQDNLNNEQFFKPKLFIQLKHFKNFNNTSTRYVTFNKIYSERVKKSFSLLIATYQIKSFFRKNIILACIFIFLSNDLFSLFTITQMELSSLTTVEVHIFLTQISLFTHNINWPETELCRLINATEHRCIIFIYES